jgi:hypothetical protein
MLRIVEEGADLQLVWAVDFADQEVLFEPGDFALEGERSRSA